MEHEKCPYSQCKNLVDKELSWCIHPTCKQFVDTKRQCTYLESIDCPINVGLGSFSDVKDFLRSIDNLDDERLGIKDNMTHLYEGVNLIAMDWGNTEITYTADNGLAATVTAPVFTERNRRVTNQWLATYEEEVLH